MSGTLEQTDGQWRLRFTRWLSQPPETVWCALTEPEHLAAWFPTDIEGERATGAILQFVFRNGEGPTIEGRMLTYDPPALLEFRWGEETMRFELRADGEGTLLTFLNTFDELGKAARDATGWDVSLDVLGHHLAGKELPWNPRRRWQDVHPSYVESFGPEAATIGPPGSP
ncbi:MAG: SRPBCC family protein [Chloroflexota bacterium]